MDDILKSILSQKRLTKNEGLNILKDYSTLEIGQLATIAIAQRGIIDDVGFVVASNPNYRYIWETE